MIEPVCKHCGAVVRMRYNADGSVWILHPAPLCEGARRTVEEAGGVVEKVTALGGNKPS